MSDEPKPKVRMIMDCTEEEGRRALSAEVPYEGKFTYAMVDMMMRLFEKDGHTPTQIILSASAWRHLTMDSSHYDPGLYSTPGQNGEVGMIWGIPTKMKRAMPMDTVEMIEIEDQAVVFRIVARGKEAESV
jgi:hypothetical protein